MRNPCAIARGQLRLLQRQFEERSRLAVSAYLTRMAPRKETESRLSFAADFADACSARDLCNDRATTDCRRSASAVRLDWQARFRNSPRVDLYRHTNSLCFLRMVFAQTATRYRK